MALLAGCLGNAGSGSYSQTAGNQGQGSTYTVMAGDSLWGISRTYGVSLQSLINANDQIAAPYVLQVGQEIRIPAVGSETEALAANAATPIDETIYFVKPGDTLYAVSRRSAIPVSTLAQSNALEPPYALQVGQRLELPADARDPELLAARAVVVPAPVPVPVAAPAPVPTAPGAAAQGTPAGTPVGTPVANAGTAGQPADLLGSLQGGPQSAAVSGRSSLTEAAVVPEEVVAVEESVTVVETAAGQDTLVETESETAVAAQAAVLQVPASKPGRSVAVPAVATEPPPPTDAALPSPPRREGRLFDWPVTGKVISTHGPKSGGLHNDGINIAAPEGTPVRAAESGVVAYTGGDLKGFGKLVLIKHSDGYVTAYAHNSQILVRRGETVRRGDVIARVGKTGSVDTPQLHFEIRKDAKPVDPSGLMVGVAG